MRRLDQLARSLLVPRMQEGEQVAHRDRLHAIGDEFRRGMAHRVLVQRHDHFALCGDLLACFFALCAGGKKHRRDRFQHDAVQVLTELIADLQDVAKSLAGDQPDLRALALQHCIGGDRRAMQEARDVARRHAEVVRQMGDGVQHRLAGIAARGGNLQRPHRFAGAAADDVGEGAADVHADIDRWCRVGHAGSCPPPGMVRCLDSTAGLRSCRLPALGRDDRSARRPGHNEVR